jgi:phosphatidylinositol alpha-1,6-mannosyltransferase
MNIAIFSTDYRPLMGGIATLTEETARRLSKKSTLIMVSSWMRGFEKFDKLNPFRTIRIINIWLVRELLFAVYIAYLVIFKNYKTVYCLVWFPCGLICYLLSRMIRFEYYCAGFGTDYIDDKKTVKRRIKCWLSGYKIKAFNNAKKVLTCSPYSKDKLVEMGVAPDNIEVVAPGVDTDVFTPIKPQEEFMRRYKTAGRRILLTVARLEEYKGQDTIIAILPRLLKKYPDLYYYMVGGGEDRQRLEKLAKDSGIWENVYFTGFVESSELVEFYRACEIFVMVSRQMDALVEGFGITFVEAAACEKPVVAGISGGTVFAVKDGVSGILLDSNDKEAIFNAIDKFLSDKEYTNNFVKNARTWVIQERTWDASAQKTFEIVSS